MNSKKRFAGRTERSALFYEQDMFESDSLVLKLNEALSQKDKA